MPVTVNWTERRVFHWAHQGGAREGPSNTVWAMRRALENGAHGLEVDVHLTRDGELVLIHDDSTWRTTGRRGSIAAMDVTEVRQLDAAHQWVPGKVDATELKLGEQWTLRGRAPTDPELRIPTLAEVLDAFPDVPINIEIKSKAAARALATFLAARPDADLLVVSFLDGYVRAFRKANRRVPTAPGRKLNALFWLMSRIGIALPIRGHSAIQVPLRFKGLRMADARLVRAAHRRGLAVHVWTLDSPNEMHEAIDIGADGIMTDRPSVLTMVMRERAVGWRSPAPP